MRITYIVNARIPTEKAHGYQITRMCAAFAEQGAKVELIVPARKNKIIEDAFSYYKIPHTFSIQTVGSLFLDTVANFVPFLGFRLRSLLFLIRLSFLRLPKGSLVYSRDPEIVWLFSLRGYSTAYDAHRFPESRVALFLFFVRRAHAVIANSHGTARAFEERGIHHIFVAHNAVDPDTFSDFPQKITLRDELALPQDKKIVMYVGHLYTWKGIDTILDAADKAKEQSDIMFLCVGGTENDVGKYRSIIRERGLSNVLILGHKKKEIIPKFLAAADILLLPNLATTKESSFYTSPIKMFEYMASGTPIIASDLRSLREVLNEGNSILVPPGDASALASAIHGAFEHTEHTSAIAQKARVDVSSHTWENRAAAVLTFLQKHAV